MVTQIKVLNYLYFIFVLISLSLSLSLSLLTWLHRFQILKIMSLNVFMQIKSFESMPSAFWFSPFFSPHSQDLIKVFPVSCFPYFSFPAELSCSWVSGGKLQLFSLLTSKRKKKGFLDLGERNILSNSELQMLSCVSVLLSLMTSIWSLEI